MNPITQNKIIRLTGGDKEALRMLSKLIKEDKEKYEKFLSEIEDNGVAGEEIKTRLREISDANSSTKD